MLRSRLLWLGLAGSGLWLLIGLWLVPDVISDAYADRSHPALNALISGREQYQLSLYLREWRELFAQLTVVVAVAALAVTIWVRWSVPRRVVARVLGTRGRPTLSPMTLAALALVVGIGGGLAEAGYHAIRAGLGGWPTSEYTREALWMAPIALAGALLCLAAVLVVLWWGRPPVRVAVTALVILVLFGFLRSLMLGLEGWAVIVLATGIAVVTARWIESRWVSVRPRLGVAAVAASAVVAMLAGVLAGVERWTEWRHRVGLPGVPDGPNVLLLILDTVRASNLSAYGYHRPTSPALERLAREGVRFDNAVATSSWTLPSHASLFTGRWRHELSAAWKARMDDEHPTLAEVFADRGYRTVGVVGNYGYAGARTGLARGFSAYLDDPMTVTMTFRNAWLTRWLLQGFLEWRGHRDILARKSAVDVNRQFLGWLSSRDESRPFFAFLNYFDPHDPYAPPEPYRSRFQTTRDYRYWTSWRRDYPPRELAELENAYDGAIAFADAQLGVLLDSLAARGVLDETIVVVASDHGESFGEHDSRLVGHGNSLYWQTIHVPLIMRYPASIPSGATVIPIVTLRDLPATLMMLAFGDDTGVPIPGASLAGCWTHGAACTPSPALSEVRPNRGVSQPWDPVAAGPIRSIARDGYHLIRSANGSVKLFALDLDPDEQRDRASEPEMGDLLAKLRATMDDIAAPERTTQ